MDTEESTLAKVKPVVTVSLYDRLEYAERTLTALSKCRLADKVPIIVNIDPRPHPVTLEIFWLARKILPNADVRIYDCHKGCNASIFYCLNDGFKVGDYVIHMEEDILFSKDALEWFIEEGEIYKDAKNVFSVCGYQRTDPHKFLSGEFDKLEEILNDDTDAETFYPWGWATWKDRWEEIKGKWAFGNHKYGGTWDLWMKKELRGNRLCVLPLVSKVKNIGEVGVHTPSKEWHKAKHSIGIWSDDILVN